MNSRPSSNPATTAHHHAVPTVHLAAAMVTIGAPAIATVDLATVDLVIVDLVIVDLVIVDLAIVDPEIAAPEIAALVIVDLEIAAPADRVVAAMARAWDRLADQQPARRVARKALAPSTRKSLVWNTSSTPSFTSFANCADIGHQWVQWPSAARLACAAWAWEWEWPVARLTPTWARPPSPALV